MAEDAYKRGWQEGRANLLKGLGLEPDGKVFGKKEEQPSARGK
jgi:hypothetical protein